MEGLKRRTMDNREQTLRSEGFRSSPSRRSQLDNPHPRSGRYRTLHHPSSEGIKSKADPEQVLCEGRWEGSSEIHIRVRRVLSYGEEKGAGEIHSWGNSKRKQIKDLCCYYFDALDLMFGGYSGYKIDRSCCVGSFADGWVGWDWA